MRLTIINRWGMTISLILLWLAGCAGPPAAEQLVPPTAVPPTWPPPPTPEIRQTPNAAPPPTATPVPAHPIGAAPHTPPELVAAGQQIAHDLPSQFIWTADATAQLVLNGPIHQAEWLWVVAAPFATIADEIGWPELQAGWQNGSGPLGQLLLDEATAVNLATLLGEPGAETQIIPSEERVSRLWAQRPSWTILPFHELQPELKLLALDGRSPLRHDFDASHYPLRLRWGWTGEAAAAAQLQAAWKGPTTNYQPDKLTRVAMTGVTALTRAVAYQMELRGVTAPGAAVQPVFAAADIAHISHEVAFAPDCPYPNPIGGTTFCARDRYLELLTFIGANLIELTGNHVNDWGAHNLSHTIDLYETAGMGYFGGGRQLEDARQPALFEHNGNRIAFVGCNPVGPAFAWATADRAGSRPCDYDTLFAQMAALQAEGYQIIATLQYWEFYHYAPTAQQRVDFRRLVEAGATAVSGSQGHHAQSFDFHQGAFIHHGLGNLFFDQMDMLGTRQAFIDTYLFYDNRLLNIELWTGLIENYCCPREMTAVERAQLLQTVFQASGW
jgi:hypothetical protein